jgi:hypothetical protein
MRRQYIFAVAMLAALIPRTNGRLIHSPSLHSRPQRMHVLAQPYHGVKNSIMRVRLPQSGHLHAVMRFAVALGACM